MHIKGTLAAVLASVCALPASAATVVAANCVSVSNAHGCLFDGNINSSGAGANSYLVAQNDYNVFNDTHASAAPDIALHAIGASNDPGFAGWGSLTGGTGSSGTWAVSGYLVDYIAVKASHYFVLYKFAQPMSAGNWNTLDIPFNRNAPALSHIVFFGSPVAVPEPASWALMIAGIGGIAGALRRRQRALPAAA